VGHHPIRAIASRYEVSIEEFTSLPDPLGAEERIERLISKITIADLDFFLDSPIRIIKIDNRPLLN